MNETPKPCRFIYSPFHEQGICEACGETKNAPCPLETGTRSVSPPADWQKMAGEMALALEATDQMDDHLPAMQMLITNALSRYQSMLKDTPCEPDKEKGPAPSGLVVAARDWGAICANCGSPEPTPQCLERTCDPRESEIVEAAREVVKHWNGWHHSTYGANRNSHHGKLVPAIAALQSLTDALKLEGS